MLKIFTGDDRVKANRDIAEYLGKDYEVVDGPDLALSDLPSLFLGQSLFAETRSILIRDLSLNKPAFEKLPEYLNTPHKIALLELKLDKRSATYKILKAQVEIKEYPLPKNPNLNLVFNIYKIAKRNGKSAVETLEKIKLSEDPIMFFGLLASQSLKDYAANQGTKEKAVLKELAKLDQDLKSAPLDPWLLIESFLLRLPTIKK